MNKTLKKVLLIMLMLTLAFTVVACTNKTDDGIIKVPGDPNPPIVIDKTAIFNKITTGLTTAGDNVQKQAVRYVNSEYTVIVNQINVSIFYEANYNITRKQDSEIKLKIYDHQFEANTLFLYYYKGVLYYELAGEKTKIPDFGGTSTFDMFYQFVTAFDMQSYFFTADFAETFNSISLFAETKNMSTRLIGEKRENITITNVNLDRVKNKVNGFIKKMFGKDTFGTKLDAITSAILGIKLSDVGNIEIGLFNASNIQVILEDKAVSDFDITFSGMQSDNINAYSFDVKYLTRPTVNEIKLDKFDDISINEYKETTQGKKHYTGSLYIPSLKETFSADIKADINTTDNSTNKFNIAIGKIVNIYYANSTMYADISGLMELYVGNGIDLNALNCPKLKFETLNIAEQLNKIIATVMEYASENISFDAIFGKINWDEIGDNITGGTTGSLIDPNSPFGILLKHVESNGTEFKITIDTELVSALIGNNSTTIMDFITSLLGISQETLETIIGAGLFNNITAVVTIDTATGALGISMYAAGQLSFKLTLQEDKSGEEVIIDPPVGFVESAYKNLIVPESATLHLEGELRMQGQDSVDFSGLMGAFIGDVTGLNTPFTFAIKDRLFLNADFWLKDGKTYSMVSLWFNPTYSSDEKIVANITSAPLINIATSPDDGAVFLVENNMFGVKYAISRDGLSTAFIDLLGEDNIFNTKNIIEILRIITRDTTVNFNENDISFTLCPYKEGTVEHDPLYDILGVKSLIADLKARVSFTAPTIKVNAKDYAIPEVEKLEDLSFESMYQAKWHTTADVKFGSTVINFKLSFIGESADLVTGKYYYEPSAKLFGEGVTYVMVLTDTENGTKKIADLGINDLRIDPTVANAIPTKIPVNYEDGKRGSQAFEIVDFPYTNENINLALLGKKRATYTIIIGKGSIKEERYSLIIEVLNRTIITAKESDGTSDAYYGDIPVVSIVNIDPYDYSINKMANADYTPFAKDLVLHFQSNQDPESGEFVTVHDYKWDFDYNLIKYSGGIYYVVGNFNTIKIAMRVEIRAKIAANIQITGEKSGEYTVDALLSGTYNIPTTSYADHEVRIYFTTGRYRIIGEQPVGWVNSDSACDGYYPMFLKWMYAKADNITLDKSINPLNSGRTNINHTIFGDDIAGLQNIQMIVNSPSRRLTTMTDNIHGITKLVINEQTGEINEDLTIRESIKLSSVGMGGIGGALDQNGITFPLDPYAKADKKVLPNTITMDTEHAGKIIRRAYVINWEESTIIDGFGNIKVPVAAENYFKATGWIGETEKNRQLVTVVIHNLSGAFDKLIMTDLNTGSPIEAVNGKYTIAINPYAQYKLPQEFTLVFNTTATSVTHKTKWQLVTDKGEEELTSEFKFPSKGGNYVLNTYVAADSANGILAQKVTLHIEVMQKVVTQGVVYGISDADMKPGEQAKAFIKVAPYEDTSRLILNKLTDLKKFGLLFNDGTFAEELPIEWDNLHEVLKALQNEGGTANLASNVIVLKGKVYKYNAALEQDVSVAIRVDAKVITAIGFPKFDKITELNEVVKLDIDIINKQININLLKPFVLSTNETDLASPSQYLKYLFSAVNLIFEDNTTNIYAVDSAMFPDDIDERAFAFGSDDKAESLITFILERFGIGSRAERYTINLRTQNDKLVTTDLSEFVETFFANGGTPKYPDGYKLSNKLEVQYNLSGKVTYSNLVWYASDNYKASEGDAPYLLTRGEVVKDQIIPSSLFKTLTGNKIWLYTMLPNGTMVTKWFGFYGKDIGGYLYDAEAADASYNIIKGRIIINNIYQVYPFDPSKLPKTIRPLTGNDNHNYQISEVINFGIIWMPTAAFARDGDPMAFDQDKINKYFNSTGYTSDYDGAKVEPFAEAIIYLYNGERQIIKLFIEVAPLDNGKVSHKDVNIVDNAFAIDPYFNNFGGNYKLPKDITVTFDGGTSYSFNPLTDKIPIKYSVQYRENGAIKYMDMDSIAYSHLGHSLDPAKFGAPTANLILKITMPDNLVNNVKEIFVTLKFLSREFKDISVQNKVTKEGQNGMLKGVYYIDPYDQTTYAVPKEASFGFTAGEDIFIRISQWSITTGVASDFNSDYIFQNKDSSFNGSEYIFSSSLAGYGVAAQEFSIKVIVLNRKLAVKYNETYTFANPIIGLVSDIPNKLTADKFVSLLDDRKYDAYNNIATPVVPNIKWNLTNDDIGYDGISNRLVEGRLSFGTIVGETANVTIDAPKLIFTNVVYADGMPIKNNVIDFNPFTKESVAKKYTVAFQRAGETVSYIFTSKEHAGNLKDPTNQQAKAIINWGEHNVDKQQLATFTIGNSFKTKVITVRQTYRYRYVQYGIKELNFGFADSRINEGYQASYDVELVIDPLNPAIPTTVKARGIDPDTGGTMEHGNVKIEWDTAIYNLPLNASEKEVMIKAFVTAYADDGVTQLSEKTPFYVKVYYLNRTPLNIYTRDSGFSDMVASSEGLYLLQSRQGVAVNHFRINPIDLTTYDPLTNTYFLPTNLVFSFKEVYGNKTINNAAERLGVRLTMSDLKWKLSKKITLDGTETYDKDGQILTSDPIKMEFTQCKISYTYQDASGNHTVTSRLYDYGDKAKDPLYELGLQVTNRTVESTSISYKVVASDGSIYQKALPQFFIDPYEADYSSSFPTTIRIKYSGDSVEKIIENVVWKYNKEYLEKPEVISGDIVNDGNPDAMNTTASIVVFGTELGISFPIKPRKIDTTTGSTTTPLSGGIIYLLKGVDLMEQLPKFMYYKFMVNGAMDVARVPLEFSTGESGLYDFDTKVAGRRKSVSATLGMEKNNIIFTLEVIDPEITSIIETGNADNRGYRKGSFVYDRINVARNGNNYYIGGKEATIMPNIVVINSTGNYLTITSIDYNHIQFAPDGTETSYAIVHCKYTFRGVTDSQNISGNIEGVNDDSDKLEISFKVPVSSYDYTKIDIPLTFSTKVYTVGLGEKIMSGSLPVALNEQGKPITLFWDLSAVDTNKAGDYKAYGYYKTTAEGQNLNVVMTVTVAPQKVVEGDIKIEKLWLQRVYSGVAVDINNYITIVPYLRENGEYGQVNYVITYSIDGGITWQTQQPIQVKDKYKVRITIDDSNITGYKEYDFNITQALITDASISFHQTENGAAVGAVTYEYDGTAKSPIIKGLPNDPLLEKSIKYEVKNTDGTYSVAQPINAGTYHVTLVLPIQRNYRSESPSYAITMVITIKNVLYSIETEMVYNGGLRDIIVVGLPQNLVASGVKVFYQYYNAAGEPLAVGAQIKNVGAYTVTVSIDGGVNYPSANKNGVVNNNLMNKTITIAPKKVVVNVNMLRSEYLEPIKPLNSAITIMDADNPTINGLQGSDNIALFNAVKVICTSIVGGVLTYRHMVGTYTLQAVPLAPNEAPSNYQIATNGSSGGYLSGTYEIIKGKDAIVINNKAELDSAVSNLKDAQEVKWYLMGGNYGAITINKNATVSIVGSYDLITGAIAVAFDSITIKKGGVTIDIIAFKARSNSSSVVVESHAQAVTVNRCEFVRSGTAYLASAVAISSASGYNNTLTIKDTKIVGYSSAVYMIGGSASITNSVFDSNIQGVQIQNGGLFLLDTTFKYTKGTAVYIISKEKEISINDCIFNSNVVGIKSYAALNNDLDVQNTFMYNSIDIQQIY